MEEPNYFYTLNDSQGFLSEEFVWRQFRLVERHLEIISHGRGGKTISDYEMETLRKNTEISAMVITKLGNGRQIELEAMKISEEEYQSVVYCLRSLVTYCHDVGDCDFSEDIYNLLQSFTCSLTKHNPDN